MADQPTEAQIELCIWCGGPTYVDNYPRSRTAMVRQVVCKLCEAAGPKFIDDAAEAIAEWNRVARIVKAHNTLIRRAQENEMLTCDQCGAGVSEEEYIETNGRCYPCGGKGTD